MRCQWSHFITDLFQFFFKFTANVIISPVSKGNLKLNSHVHILMLNRLTA
ncbi:hypothetical protein VIBNISO65_490001 [Vibrio nigripulchritudo SO65]|nr:hypothetical protein VIBNIAM115_710001 [Vibrio nigripulchritudo AM115]CCN39940.1 hypothetical protein VIBNIFTn2_1180001 [Vibrio nigripulchritudo FTn2]CCN64810.1 hypothetical protein VIBNIPon4_280046 [Vibrio nigripulchritudo POn4]CCN78204.1 hypothetical protein VIBNISO65_490001 [Vibrio nigripulchritudo SO65]